MTASAPQDANAVIAAMGKDFNPRQIKAGQSFDLTYSVATIDATGQPPKPAAAARPRVMVNHKPVMVPVEVSRQPAHREETQPADLAPAVAAFLAVASTRTSPSPAPPTAAITAEIVKKELQVHRHRAGGTIDGSLYLSGMQAGIPADVVVDMIHMFAYKVDFQRDLHPGDRFEVYYDYYYTPEGQPAKYGAISYAMHAPWAASRSPCTAIQPDPNEPAEYFDAKGQSAKGHADEDAGGRRAHLIGLRIALPSHPGIHPHAQGRGLRRAHRHAGDGGGRRHHQVHGLEPTAMAISSRSTMATAMPPAMAICRASRPACASGAKVRQGQIFAYSGMTGMATGPHLHYETFVNGTPGQSADPEDGPGPLAWAARTCALFQEKRLEIDNLVANATLESQGGRQRHRSAPGKAK